MTHTPRPWRVVPSITNWGDREHVRVRQMNRWPHMDPNPRDSTGHPSTSTHTRHLSCTRLAPLRRHRRRRTHVELGVDGCEDALTTSVLPHFICGRPAFGPLLGRIPAAVCSPVNQRFPGRLPSDLAWLRSTRGISGCGSCARQFPPHPPLNLRSPLLWQHIRSTEERVIDMRTSIGGTNFPLRI